MSNQGKSDKRHHVRSMLARESLLLPVHQDLQRYHIEFMADAVTAWGVENA